MPWLHEEDLVSLGCPLSIHLLKEMQASSLKWLKDPIKCLLLLFTLGWSACSPLCHLSLELSTVLTEEHLESFLSFLLSWSINSKRASSLLSRESCSSFLHMVPEASFLWLAWGNYCSFSLVWEEAPNSKSVKGQEPGGLVLFWRHSLCLQSQCHLSIVWRKA